MSYSDINVEIKECIIKTWESRRLKHKLLPRSSVTFKGKMLNLQKKHFRKIRSKELQWDSRSRTVLDP